MEGGKENNAAAGKETTSGNTTSQHGWLELIFYFLSWYALLVACNVYTKQVLEKFPYPYTVTMSNLGLGLLYVVPMWLLEVRPVPKIGLKHLASLFPVAVFHAIGTTVTNMSIQTGPLYLTHMLKVAEPIASTIAAWAILKSKEIRRVYLCLLLISVGVLVLSVSSLTDAEEQASQQVMPCIVAAMGANVAFALRSIMSKKAKIQSAPQDHLTPANIFALLVIMSFVSMLPVVFLTEWSDLREGFDNAYEHSVDKYAFQQQMLIAGLTYYLCNDAAYLVLGLCKKNSALYASAVGGGTIKRAVVIVASVVYFESNVSNEVLLGCAVALVGDFALVWTRLHQQHGKAAHRPGLRRQGMSSSSSSVRSSRSFSQKDTTLKPRRINFEEKAPDGNGLPRRGILKEVHEDDSVFGDTSSVPDAGNAPRRRKRTFSFDRFKKKKSSASVT